MRSVSALILSLAKLVPVSPFTTTAPLCCIQRHQIHTMASSHSKPDGGASSIALSTPSLVSLANSDDNEVDKYERKKNKEEECGEEEGENNDEKTYEEETLSKDKHEDKTTTGPSIKKVHTVTVCLVPPPKYGDLWEAIGQMRLELKDPGFYRWPPHANLLYPFLQLAEDHDGNDDDGTAAHGVDIEETVQKLRNATRTCPPFPITLNRFGTFGGAHRGVLWLSPESSSSPSDHISSQRQDADHYENNETSIIEPPLIILQKHLQQAFPICNDQSIKGAGRNFTPHMTLSYFETLSDAQSALERLQCVDSAAASDDATTPPFSSKSNND